MRNDQFLAHNPQEGDDRDYRVLSPYSNREQPLPHAQCLPRGPLCDCHPPPYRWSTVPSSPCDSSEDEHCLAVHHSELSVTIRPPKQVESSSPANVHGVHRATTMNRTPPRPAFDRIRQRPSANLNSTTNTNTHRGSFACATSGTQLTRTDQSNEWTPCRERRRKKNIPSMVCASGASRHVTATATAVVALLAMVLTPSQVGADWIDPDTADYFHSTRPLSQGDNREFKLVFSDEFDAEGRTFHDGRDPRWTAISKNDYTNDALHFYDANNAVTSGGVLNITTEQKVNIYKAFNEKTHKFYPDKKHIQTAMLQGWNKFCFVGGIIEFSAKLPGKPHTGGLWPALWLMGNLARATFVGSSDYVWPFSYNICNDRTRHSQEINACSRVNHYGLHPFDGRGAPEIDILESMQGESGSLPNTHIQRPYQSASLQVAPGIEINRPNLGDRPVKGHWYDHLEYGHTNNTDLNPFFYGVTLVHEPKIYTYQSDAISANVQLNNTHFERHHTYRLEWEPAQPDGSGGYVKWFTDNELAYGIYGDSLQIMRTMIPREPMYLLMNTAVSKHWGFPAPCPDGCTCDCFECSNPLCECALPTGYCDNFPAHFEIDYVRVFQAVNDSNHILGCSPEDRPTKTFIEGHPKRYMTEGQSMPLQPIIRGGAACTSSSHCGGSKRGLCSSGTCTCKENWTGPSCLAHSGFYDFDTSAVIPEFPIHWIKIPNSFIVVIGVLLLVFLLSINYTMRRKAQVPKYLKMSTLSSANDGMTAYATSNVSYKGSYQNSDGAHYALPPSQKVVTYCVIDGRLMDTDAIPLDDVQPSNY